MAVATSTLLGRPVWYELMTTDMKAAESFYKTVVGWTTEPFPGAGQPYTALNRSGRRVDRRHHEPARRNEGAAVLGHVRRRAQARGRRGADHDGAAARRTPT